MFSLVAINPSKNHLGGEKIDLDDGSSHTLVGQLIEEILLWYCWHYLFSRPAPHQHFIKFYYDIVGTT